MRDISQNTCAVNERLLEPYRNLFVNLIVSLRIILLLSFYSYLEFYKAVDSVLVRHSAVIGKFSLLHMPDRIYD